MYHFIYATKDSWITSGSDHTTGTEFKEQNFGRDQILEVKKSFFNDSFDYATRALINFTGTGFNEMSQSIVNGEITNPKFYLRLYEAEGNSQISKKYTLNAQPLSQSWDEGIGKFDSNPQVKNGVSWMNRTFPNGGTATTWSLANGAESGGGAIHSVSQSTQAFDFVSPDVSMNITNMTKCWLSGSNNNGFDNYGLLLRFLTTAEINTELSAQLKFFSSNTNTIYSPKLEVRWDDHTAATGNNTGSLTQITSSGLVDNYVYPIGLRSQYKESEKVKFRFGVRKRYIQKTFSTSVQTVSGSYIPESSGSYSIVDIATGEDIVPFDNSYTLTSCDSTSPYFNQWLNGFAPDRIYKVLIKIKYDDNQEIIYDDGFEFKVIN